MVVCKAKALRSKELGGSFCPSPQGLANSSLSKLNPYKVAIWQMDIVCCGFGWVWEWRLI